MVPLPPAGLLRATWTASQRMYPAPHVPQGLGEGGEEVVELVAEQGAHRHDAEKKPAMIPSKVFFPGPSRSD